MEAANEQSEGFWVSDSIGVVMVPDERDHS